VDINDDADTGETHNNTTLPSNYYFDNAAVERLIREYHKTGCTDVALRDKIMENASELIINVIYTHNLHNIYGGNDDSSFNDLFQLAYVQIESTLYKFNLSKGHSKVFNMWSQVARTAILADIKKKNRDRKNVDKYKAHLSNKLRDERSNFYRMLDEAKDIFKYSDEHMAIINALEKLLLSDNKPHEGIICKLSKLSKLPKLRVAKFLRIFRVLCGLPGTDKITPNLDKIYMSSYNNDEE